MNTATTAATAALPKGATAPVTSMKYAGINFEIKKVTPNLAKAWLSKNLNFRKLSNDRAEGYANQMLKGYWELNGESIKFDNEGNLVDGQHRLRGLVIASEVVKNISFETLVVYGVTPANVDTGQSRTLSQLVASRGYKNSNVIAAALNYYYMYNLQKSFSSGKRIPPLARNEAVILLESNQTMLESMKITQKSQRLFNRHALHTTLHYLFAERTTFESATDFYSTLIEGVNLKGNSPIYHLRESLIKHRSMEAKLAPNPYAGRIIKAWNLWFDNKSVKSFAYKYNVEGIPEIKSF